MQYNILCTICCRGGSKGVKNKNIRPLLGKPLIAYTIEQAQKSQIFSHIVLSTDSEEIAKIGKQYGAEVFFLREKKLATDEGKLPAIRDALIKSEVYYNTTFDIVFDLDATSPLRDIQDIIDAYRLFLCENNDMLITASPARKNPYFNLVEIFQNKETGKIYVDLSKQSKTPILRRQDAPKCYDMNASIYIWKREALFKYDDVLGEMTSLYIMPEERSIDIDTETDLHFVEFLLKKNYE